jgi:hypothetical protein
MREKRLSDTGDIKHSSVLGLTAVGIAGAELLALLAAHAFGAMGRRWADLSDRFGWLVFDYGFLMDVAATLLGIIAIIVGGRNRRPGLVALGLVALSFVLLFVP